MRKLVWYLRGRIRSTRLAVVTLLVVLCHGLVGAGEPSPYPPFGTDKNVYLDAIRQTDTSTPGSKGVTGLIVPHHMLAADLIAKGYHAVARGDYDRILVLAPDHFFKSTKPFATTRRGFETVLSLVETDVSAVDGLLEHSDLFEVSGLFAKEHGLRVHFPFIRHFFKGVPIVPIAVSIRSTKADWDRALPVLLELVTDKTLIIQSTDFSHYLPPYKAAKRDQEVLNLMAAGDADAIARLHQPDHIDSVGAHYLHMKLQEARFKAKPRIIANRNSQHYFKRRISRTTSYVVATYQSGIEPAFELADGKTFYFAGDTLLGRHFTPLLADEQIADALVTRVLALTGGKPLIVNLEGIILDEIPSRLRLDAMTMPVDLALPLLKRLNVVAVSLANNHTMDLGRVAYAEMKTHLEKAGIKVLSHGTITDLGPFRLATFSDLSNSQLQRTKRISKTDMEQLCRSNASPPLVAFIHWGKEGRTSPEQREMDLAEELQQCAVSSLIGVHSHKASLRLATVAGGQMQTLYSLGNFLFDQHKSIASGSLLEVRFFKQGTFFSRLIPLPNLYDLAHSHH
jgi:AmmeMemoRadiSam system protein B